MSAGLMLYSTTEITWGQLTAFIYDSLPQVGFKVTYHSTEMKAARLLHHAPEVDYDIKLTTRGDNTAFLLKEMEDKIHLPLMTAIGFTITSPLTYDQVDRPTLELLCAFATQWSIIVDNDGNEEGEVIYTNAELFQRLKDEQTIFP